MSQEGKKPFCSVGGECIGNVPTIETFMQSINYVGTIGEYLQNVNVDYDEGEKVMHIHIKNVATKQFTSMGKITKIGSTKNWKLSFWYKAYGVRTFTVKIYQHLAGQYSDIKYNSGNQESVLTAEFKKWESSDIDNFYEDGYVTVKIETQSADLVFSITDMELIMV